MWTTAKHCNLPFAYLYVKVLQALGQSIMFQHCKLLLVASNVNDPF